MDKTNFDIHPGPLIGRTQLSSQFKAHPLWIFLNPVTTAPNSPISRPTVEH